MSIGGSRAVAEPREVQSLLVEPDRCGAATPIAQTGSAALSQARRRRSQLRSLQRPPREPASSVVPGSVAGRKCGCGKCGYGKCG